ncbi:hypothetical protein FQN52_009332 [Onygenales sp. PD_12]|nr:hypothetical protein FQN52_009332 [Onygenales sp. PD_12]
MASGKAYQPKIGLNRHHEPGWVIRPSSFLPLKMYTAPRIQRDYFAPIPSLGNLGTLPLELREEILMELDLDSIGKMRLLNTTSKILVDNLYAYKVLRQHAPDVLHVIHSMEMSPHLLIRQLFSEFCQPKCRVCDDFGPFIFVPTCTRCCWNCLSRRKQTRFQLVPPGEVALHTLLTRNALQSLPRMKTLPGASCGRHVYVNSVTLVSVHEAKQLSVRILGSSPRCYPRSKMARRYSLDSYFTNSVIRRNVRGLLNKGGHDMENHSGKSSDGSCDRNDGPAMNPFMTAFCDRWKYMGATPFGFWSNKTQTLERGLYCSACTNQWECRYGRQQALDTTKIMYHRAYLGNNIREHFRDCTATKNGYSGTTMSSWRRHKRHGSDFFLMLPDTNRTDDSGSNDYAEACCIDFASPVEQSG